MARKNLRLGSKLWNSSRGASNAVRDWHTGGENGTPIGTLSYGKKGTNRRRPQPRVSHLHLPFWTVSFHWILAVITTRIAVRLQRWSHSNERIQGTHRLIERDGHVIIKSFLEAGLAWFFLGACLLSTSTTSVTKRVPQHHEIEWLMMCVNGDQCQLFNWIGASAMDVVDTKNDMNRQKCS